MLQVSSEPENIHKILLLYILHIESKCLKIFEFSLVIADLTGNFWLIYYIFVPT